MVCNQCGFKYSAGETCPSCGHTNSESDPECIARKKVKEYNDRKPKTWVIVLSVIGILVNAVLVISYFSALLGPSSPTNDNLLLALFILIQIAINILMIVSFIHLIRMRKWALWVIRIAYTISTVLLAIRGNLISVQFVIGVVLTLVFWIGDWKDYS